MSDLKDTIETLEVAKRHVSRMAWALSIQVKDDGKVEREGELINDWIDGGIKKLSERLAT